MAPTSPSQTLAIEATGPTGKKPGEVSVTWAFFDKSHPEDNTRIVDIPGSLYNGPSQFCRQLFVNELFKELDFTARVEDIKFWKPKQLLLVSKTVKYGWTASITTFRDHFDDVPFPCSFANALTVDNRGITQLIVTAKGSYSSTGQEEVNDAVPRLQETKRYHTIVSTKGKSPSEGAMPMGYSSVQDNPGEAIYDGRYPHDLSTIAPPIQIFHPIFEEFIYHLNDPQLQPSDQDLLWVQELMCYASRLGQTVHVRNEGIRKRLRKILDATIYEEPNVDRTIPSGVQMINVDDARIPLLIVELQQELGDGGCDPATKAGISFRHTWIEDSRKNIRDKCCCPTLILASGGPWLTVLGGVLTDKVIVQRLTDMMWIGLSSTAEDSRVYHVTRVLIALRASLKELRDFYEDIGNADIQTWPNTSHPRFYPYAASFTEGTHLFHFQYVGALDNAATCVTYLAHIVGDDASDTSLVETDNDMPSSSKEIVVKFVTRYGQEVHQFLANKGYAPALRYYGSLSGVPQLENVLGAAESAPHCSTLQLGPMKMVVMDYVITRPEPPLNARQQIRDVLIKLHSEGYVFGNLRMQNILFNMGGAVKFIDFNWSGSYDKNAWDGSLPEALLEMIEENKHLQSATDFVHYPLALSPMIHWPDGVDALKPIRPVHDWLMFNDLPC